MDSEQALKEKELGNSAYKNREFNAALEHYQKAVELDATNMSYLNNMAAVYFEQKQFEKCVAQCEKAVEVGREHRADFKDIAKALRRSGNAHLKLGDLPGAKMAFEKSLSEHRTVETRALLADVLSKIKEAELRAEIDPEQAEVENTLGNVRFLKGCFSKALKHYTAAILRNPKEPYYFSNRAACYTKLAEFGLGLKDSDACIALDARFVKGWVRKGTVLQGMREFGRALTAFQTALEIHPNNADARRGCETCAVSLSADPIETQRRAMADPEICAIVNDPAMVAILQQMEHDPKAVEEHMKSPVVAENLHKLNKAGVIVTRRVY